MKKIAKKIAMPRDDLIVVRAAARRIFELARQSSAKSRNDLQMEAAVIIKLTDYLLKKAAS